MDKYEYKLSLTEIKRLVNERRFEEAAAVADTVDWKRVKTPETLCLISDIYKMIKEYEKSQALLVYANTRRPGDPSIVYSLCELTIFLYGQKERADYLMSALQLVKEYQALEPANPRRLILQYKMYNVSPVSSGEKIALLEQLKKESYSARWGYELAQLYKADGQTEKAAAQYRDLIVKFGGTKYAEAAQDELSELVPNTQADSFGDLDDEDDDMKIADRSIGKTETPEAAPDDRQTAVLTKEDDSFREAAEKIDELPVPAPEEQAAADTARKTVAKGMSEIYSAPFESRISQESNGQYKMVMNDEKKPETQIEGQMTIGEVMDEWEKIRHSIRSANDKKRAMRILEDTGPLLQDFDNNAKHGLLEDIEKGVSRQRRSERSSLPGSQNYRDEDSYAAAPTRRRSDLYENTPARRAYDPYEEAPARRGYDDRYDDRYDDAPGRSSRESEYYEEPAYEDKYQDEPYPEDSYQNDSYPEEPAYERPSYKEPVYEDEEPAYNEPEAEEPAEDQPVEEEAEAETPATEEPAADEPAAEEPVRESFIKKAPARSRSLYEEYDRDDDEYAADGASTRRWNSEEVKRAMERQQARVAAAQAELDAEAAIRNAREAQIAAYGAAAAYVPAREARSEQIGAAAQAPCEEVHPASVQEPVKDQPEKAEPVKPEPVYKEPEYEAPAEEEPAYEEPVREPAYEEPEYEEPEYEEEERAYEKSVKAQPVEEEPVYEEPVREEPEYEEPVKDEPEPAEEVKDEPEEKPAAGTRRLTKEELRGFGPFSRVKENRQQLAVAIDKMSLAAHTGNLIITGNEQSAQRVAQNILEIIRKSDPNFTGKIAKASAESLNKLNADRLSSTLKKIDNGALIISKASEMTDNIMGALHRELDGRSGGLIVILCDVRKNWDQFAARHSKDLVSFNASIDIKPLPDKAMVQYAKDYAKSKEYSIDEFGEMALRAKISSMQTPQHHVSLREVREIVDDAIAHASKGAILRRVGGKYKDEDGRIILHEKDFAQYKK